MSWYKKGQNGYDYSCKTKWARLDKEYHHFDWTSDANIWFEVGQGDDIYARKMIGLKKCFDQVINC